MTQEWTRAEGMIIGDELDPNAVREELHERGVLAQLEWFASTPHMLSLTVATDGERIATVPAGSEQVEAGPALEELAEDIAGLFKAEVRIGSVTADHLPQGDSPLGRAASDDGAPAPMEKGRRPASSR